MDGSIMSRGSFSRRHRNRQEARMTTDTDEALVEAMMDAWFCGERIADMRAVLSVVRQHDAPRIAALEAWQPIETAPKDGTEVIAFTNEGSVTTAYWCSTDYWPGMWMNWDSRSDGLPVWPTHWMPLPEPPATPSQEPPHDR